MDQGSISCRVRISHLVATSLFLTECGRARGWCADLGFAIDDVRRVVVGTFPALECCFALRALRASSWDPRQMGLGA